eukprot:1140887-Pelagomonas_calceolata.AAC.3
MHFSPGKRKEKKRKVYASHRPRAQADKQDASLQANMPTCLVLSRCCHCQKLLAVTYSVRESISRECGSMPVITPAKDHESKPANLPLLKWCREWALKKQRISRHTLSFPLKYQGCFKPPDKLFRGLSHPKSDTRFNARTVLAAAHPDVAAAAAAALALADASAAAAAAAAAAAVKEHAGQGRCAGLSRVLLPAPTPAEAAQERALSCHGARQVGMLQRVLPANERQTKGSQLRGSLPAQGKESSNKSTWAACTRKESSVEIGNRVELELKHHQNENSQALTKRDCKCIISFLGAAPLSIGNSSVQLG